MPKIFRTVEGKHVPEGHPDAAVLAYGDGDEVPAEVLKEAGVKPEPSEPVLEEKKAEVPANKSVKAKANK